MASYEKELKVKNGNGYSAAHAGSFSGLHQFEFAHPLMKSGVPGKLFLREPLSLTSMQVSLNKLPAGKAVPFYHKHKQNEELYIFIKGSGQMQINGEIIDVTEGSSIRIAPDAERTWRNNSNEDLYYIVIQAKEGSLSQDTIEDGIPGDRPIQW